MPSYYLAPCLRMLQAEVNGRWQGRDRTSDGWIGDASHQARKSDHNPDWAAGGVVRAVDLDKDGMDAGWVIACAIQDDRTNYVIHNRLIYQRIHGFSPRRYTGPNAHLGHVHISIRHGRYWENNPSPWLDNAVPPSRPVADQGGTIPTLDVPTPTGQLPGALDPVTLLEDRMITRVRVNDDQPRHATGIYLADLVHLTFIGLDGPANEAADDLGIDLVTVTSDERDRIRQFIVSLRHSSNVSRVDD